MCLRIAAEKVYWCSARDEDSKCHDVEEISMLLKLVEKVLGSGVTTAPANPASRGAAP